MQALSLKQALFSSRPPLFANEKDVSRRSCERDIYENRLHPESGQFLEASGPGARCHLPAGRVRATMAHSRQSRPDHGHGFEVKVRNLMWGFSSSRKNFPRSSPTRPHPPLTVLSSRSVVTRLTLQPTMSPHAFAHCLGSPPDYADSP